jgi:hypothetical protein
MSTACSTKYVEPVLGHVPCPQCPSSSIFKGTAFSARSKQSRCTDTEFLQILSATIKCSSPPASEMCKPQKLTHTIATQYGALTHSKALGARSTDIPKGHPHHRRIPSTRTSTVAHLFEYSRHTTANLAHALEVGNGVLYTSILRYARAVPAQARDPIQQHLPPGTGYHLG